MRVVVTPELVALTIDLLRATAPFKHWKIPSSDEIKITILRTDQRWGDHEMDGEQHHIRISQAKHKTLRSLIETVAHELVHVEEAERGVRADVMHGAAFKKLAAKVCAIHGFDPGSF